MAHRLIKAFTLATSSVIALAAFTAPAMADPIITPFITGLIISGLPSVAVTLGISGTLALAGVLSSVVTSAITFGLSYLATALLTPRQRQPSPEQRQGLIRESAHTRFRSYGLVKVAGVLAYVAVDNGSLYRVIAHGHGRISEVVEHWIDDNKVEINPSTGWVTTPPFADRVKIQYTLGDQEQVAYQDLITAIPTDWTAAHKGNGIPHSLVTLAPISIEEFPSVFPTGEPNYKQVQKSACVFDARDPTQIRSDELTWKYSSNAALVLLDYITHPDGMALPWSMVEPALSLWIEAADVCDQQLPRYGGGSVPRYQICNSYDLYGERRADILARFLQACDGLLFNGPDGSLALRVGRWEEPTVIIDDATVLDYEAIRGDNITTATNVVSARYASPEHNFSTIDAPDLRDDPDIAARGRFATVLELMAVPNQNQVRRLMKLALARARRDWTLSLSCNLKGLAIAGHRFVRIRLSELEIDDTFEILGDPEFLLGENMTLQGVRFSAGTFRSSAYDFNSATEELETLIPPPISSDDGVPLMTGLGVTILRETVTGGQTVAYAEFTWTAASNVSYTPALRMKKTSDDATKWVPVSVAQGANKARSNVLEDGAAYEVQGRFIGISAGPGNWSASVNFTGVADTVAPAQLSSLSLSTAPDTVTVAYTTPNDIHYVKTRIYRSKTNDSVGATFVQDVFSSRNAVQGITLSVVSDQAYGTWFYWAAAANGSNIDAGRQATTPISVLVASNNLIVNGDFASGANWTPGTDWSIASGVATKVAGAAGTAVTQAMTLVVGASYEITFTVTARTAGTVAPRFTGGTTVTGTARNAVGTYVETLVAVAGNNTFGLFGTSVSALSVDNVSIRRVG